MPKTAAWGDVRNALLNTISQPSTIAMLAAPVVGLGVGKIESRLRDRRAAANKATAYREMLGLHPHLTKRDPGEVNRIYNSLYNVSPTMAVDPMVAGAWVDNVIESKGVGYNSHQGLLTAVKELSGMERSVADTQRARLQLPVAEGTRSFVTELGKQVDKGGKKSLRAYVNQLKAKADADIEKKTNQFNSKVDVFQEQRQGFIDMLDKRERDLDQREATLYEHFGNPGHDKKSSSCELDELFRALGV